MLSGAGNETGGPNDCSLKYFENTKLRGIQNYFPENFICNLTYYEGDNFSDSFFHHIFESENLRIPFYSLRKIA